MMEEKATVDVANDLISRSEAIDALELNHFPGDPYIDVGIEIAIRVIRNLSPAKNGAEQI